MSIREFDLRVTIPIGQRIINAIVSEGLLDMSCVTDQGHGIMAIWSERAAKAIGNEAMRAIRPSNEWIASKCGSECNLDIHFKAPPCCEPEPSEQACDDCDSDYESCCGSKSPPDEPEEDSQSTYFVDDIIRVQYSFDEWRIYRITGFADGQPTGETTYELEAIDTNSEETLVVPCVLLDTHPGVEKVK